jgi:hypothetical protein
MLPPHGAPARVRLQRSRVAPASDCSRGTGVSRRLCLAPTTSCPGQGGISVLTPLGRSVRGLTTLRQITYIDADVAVLPRVRCADAGTRRRWNTPIRNTRISPRLMTPELLTSTRELDSRTNNGIRVRLMWCESDGRLFVTVNDHKTGEAFSVEVPDIERALSVFHHPYAYAA